MYYTGNGNYTLFVNFGPPPQPRCHKCNAVAKRHTPDGRQWCERCVARESAPELFALLFAAVAPEQRSRLYRALATVFHPDAGGDEHLMQTLNAVKERYP